MTVLTFGTLTLDSTETKTIAITELEISTDADTDDKNSGKDGYIKFNNAKASEVTLTAILDAGFGCDVRQDAVAMVEAARTGDKDYIYLDGEKLLPWKMILTEADVQETQIGPNGKWSHAEVELTWEQGEKKETEKKKSGSSSSGSSGRSSGGASGGSSGSSSGNGGSSSQKQTVKAITDSAKSRATVAEKKEQKWQATIKAPSTPAKKNSGGGGR